ncbi:uncharacterized skeletal organic matrix protein 5-like [Montipora foliosa]|uniref:uncharacterized skeletal organic matrix protein 5-like n=1 Tax=Montipora foliosa TaxID=591990 RepID=UPI0035F20160
MKTAIVLLALLMMTVASVAKQNACCGEAIESFEEKMINLIAEFKENCHQPPPVASSCKELYNKNTSLKSGLYPLLLGSERIPVYCHMGDFGCGTGGWTTVMKIDGRKSTFQYDSTLWSNQTAFNRTGGMTGFNQEETKLPSYWTTNFSKICLGMKIGNQINFVVIDKQARSLYSLIADGMYRPTSLQRSKWKMLVGPTASLQYHCNKQGFNVVPAPTTWIKVRIGFVANNEYHCSTCDSFIGFGSVVFSLTCGNGAAYGPDNGRRHTAAMGYILVQ